MLNAFGSTFQNALSAIVSDNLGLFGITGIKTKILNKGIMTNMLTYSLRNVIFKEGL